MEVHAGVVEPRKESKSEILFCAKPPSMYTDYLTFDGADLSDVLLPGGLFMNIVFDFKYLGSYISDAKDVDSCITSAGKAFGALSACLFRSDNISISAKRSVYEGLVLAILLYGSECWVLTEALRQRLHVFHAQCLRTMCRVTRLKVWEESISTKALADEMGIKPIDTYIYRRQARWLGHVARMPFERLPRKMFSSWVAAPRLQGEQLPFDLQGSRALCYHKTTWHELAQDRPAWRGAINGALLNAKRPKRAAAVETNRRMDAMIADGHALMSNASILASQKRAAEKPLGTIAPKRWRGGVYPSPI
jgi:hypothetical protein